MIPIMQFNIMHTAYATTETEKPPEQATVGIQCDLLAAPPLQKLVPHGPHPSLDDSFVTEETDTDMDTLTWTHLLHAVSKITQLSKCICA